MVWLGTMYHFHVYLERSGFKSHRLNSSMAIFSLLALPFQLIFTLKQRNMPLSFANTDNLDLYHFTDQNVVQRILSSVKQKKLPWVCFVAN